MVDSQRGWGDPLTLYYIVDWGKFVHRVNSDIIRNGAASAIWMEAIRFREQSCLHKSPTNSARNKLNFTLKLPFFEAESPKWIFCFLAHMLFKARAFLEFRRKFQHFLPNHVLGVLNISSNFPHWSKIHIFCRILTQKAKGVLRYPG